jgi:predicted dehydrogenase
MAIRIAVAGIGVRGRSWVREIRASPAFELVACVDVDRNAFERASQILEIPARQHFVDLDRALVETRCEAVVVATPAECHFANCETALSRSVAVLVEKPFTVGLKEANRLVLLAESKAVPLLVAQNYRYLRSFRTVRRLIGEGKLGQVGMVICQYYRVPHDMSPSLARSTQSAMWGVGVHHLDALRYVLRDEVEGVMSDNFTLPWTQLPQGASMRALLSFASGTRAFYSATYESSGHEFFERGQEFYARFIGEHATLHVFQRWLLLCEKGKLPRIVRRGTRKSTEEQILLQQLANALLTGSEADSSGRDNLQTMAVVDACVRSSAEKVWVNPQELLDEQFK